MLFVVLDLETTGLSPETDTIIEVAAIRFGLERSGDGSYHAVDIEERSMLINPGIPLSEEVRMITHIDDAMLVGKPVWSEVQDNVRAFIGDATIVGHNVLFDIAMLATHGIDLTGHPVLDTFELSEIFSQEVESLNLGFLAQTYNIHTDKGEHRALGDTWLSLGLFLRYINQSARLTPREISILALAGTREVSANIGLYCEIVGLSTDAVYALPTITHSSQEKPTPPPKTSPQKSQLTATSLPGTQLAEMSYLQDILTKHQSATLLVAHKKIGLHLEAILNKNRISAEYIHAPHEYCATDIIAEMIAKSSWSRKEAILMVKILFWLDSTETGLLDELKFYGDERAMIAPYRGKPGMPTSRKTQENSPKIEIRELSSAIKYQEYGESSALIFRDIGFFTDIFRRAISTPIDVDQLCRELANLDAPASITDSLRLIEGIYRELPQKIPNDTPPPGEYGETYFFRGEDVWNLGKSWLPRATQSLQESWNTWKDQQQHTSATNAYYIDEIHRSITALSTFHLTDNASHAILRITGNSLVITLIPYTPREMVSTFLQQFECQAFYYGAGLDGEIIGGFLEQDIGISVNPAQERRAQYLKVQEEFGEILGGTIVLTTSSKHARELTHSIRKTHPHLTILTQGISGGKSKMIGLFGKKIDESIIIGTIENWRDEYSIWNQARKIIIAKMPFDPPTDVQFLARTAGMRNNFENYSMPMVVMKINTIIEHLFSANGSNPPIICLDSRLKQTEWGMKI